MNQQKNQNDGWGDFLTKKLPSRVALERLRLYHLIEFKKRERAKKMQAAKRALSLIHKLKNESDRKKHFSRVFSLMNKIRFEI